MADVGPIANPRLCIMAHNGTVAYKWQIYFITISEGTFNYAEIITLLDQLEHTSGYVVCPGITNFAVQDKESEGLGSTFWTS